MISDINTQIASAQVLNVATATEEPTENSIDVGGTARSAMTHPEGSATGSVLDTIASGTALQRDIAEGEPLYLVYTISTALTGVTSVQFRIITSANADLSSSRLMIETDEIAVANLTAGKQIVMRVMFDPANKDDTLERYFGGAVIGVGAGTLEGVFDCHLVHGNQAGGKKFYATSTIIAHKTTAS